jgi:hypothetical protein
MWGLGDAVLDEPKRVEQASESDRDVIGLTSAACAPTSSA